MKKNINISLIIFLVLMLVVFNSLQTITPQSDVKKPIVPGEQAPPADPGQKNLGDPALLSALAD